MQEKHGKIIIDLLVKLTRGGVGLYEFVGGAIIVGTGVNFFSANLFSANPDSNTWIGITGSGLLLLSGILFFSVAMRIRKVNELLEELSRRIRDESQMSYSERQLLFESTMRRELQGRKSEILFPFLSAIALMILGMAMVILTSPLVSKMQSSP